LKPLRRSLYGGTGEAGDAGRANNADETNTGETGYIDEAVESKIGANFGVNLPHVIGLSNSRCNREKKL